MAFITFQFSCQDDLGSEAIRIFEHGEYSHVDMVLDDGSLLGARDDVMMGIAPGVQVRPSAYVNFSAVKVVKIPCTDDEKTKFYSLAFSQVGKPYDESAILAFVAGRNWRSEDSWFCSELGLWCLEGSFLPYKAALTENKATPGDLFLVSSVFTDVWS